MTGRRKKLRLQLFGVLCGCSVLAAQAADGLFQKPLLAEGINTTFQFGGYAQADLIHDFDAAGEQDQFVVSSIPVEGDPGAEAGSRNSFSLKQTRLTLDTRSNTSIGEIRTNFEGDFFGSGRAFEVLYAYAEWNGVMAGKFVSTFADPNTQPNTLDYEGPDGEVCVQQLLLRYTGRVGDSFEWAVAIEQPDNEIFSDFSGKARDEYPDLPAYVRWNRKERHVQLGGILRKLRYDADEGVSSTAVGWGVNLTGSILIKPRSTLMGQAVYGAGIARYIQAFNGEDADGVYLGNGDLKALGVWSILVGVEHEWTDRLTSTLSADYANVNDHAGRAGDSIKSSTAMHLNLVWTPRPLWSIGGEVMWGKRENLDGASGDATRLQFSVNYSFR